MSTRRPGRTSVPGTAGLGPDLAWSVAPSPAQPTIADDYVDLLRYLPAQQRRGLLSRLIHGYYDDWRPSREQVADLVAVELGVLTADQAADRDQHRRSGNEPASFTPRLRAQHRPLRSSEREDARSGARAVAPPVRR